MIVAEFTTVAFVKLVDVDQASCATKVTQPDRCELTGLERHGGALILLGILVLLMAWGAGLGRSRPAGAALLLVGALVIGLALVRDLPVTNDAGSIGIEYHSAEGAAGFGFYLELVAGALAVLAGLSRVLRRAAPVVGALLLLLVLAAPAAAQDEFPHSPGEQFAPIPHVEVGIGENRGSFLGDRLFDRLGIRRVRLIVPYDLVRAGGRRLRDTDSWLQAARDRGLDVLVAFGFSGRKRLRWHLPSTAEYSDRVSEFMERYSWIHEYSTWNEANHKRVQPTGIHPQRTAVFYRALRQLCVAPECTTVAVDVLLTGTARTWRWIQAFKRRAGPGPHIWGIHNYPDANRMSTRRTRHFLRAVRGEVWFTETGGIVRFGRYKPNERRAARAIRNVFRLAELSPRVKRVYLYSWRGVYSNRRWDSALISPAGRIRAGYRAMVEELALDRFNPSLPVEPPPVDFTPLPDPPTEAAPE